jgi:hypothetical protein
MKIIKIKSCLDCGSFSAGDSENPDYCCHDGVEFVEPYDGIPDWCPLEAAVECPICEGPSCVHTEQVWKAYFKIPASPCSCPTVISPGIIICGTCGGEII